MHFCHIAASCLLTYTSVAFYTLHYGSIRLVPSKNSSTHLYVANLRCTQAADSRTALATLWRRGSAPDHDCDNETLSWSHTSQIDSPCKQPQERWISSVGVLRVSKNDETTSSRYRGGNVETKPDSAHFFISNWLSYGKICGSSLY